MTYAGHKVSLDKLRINDDDDTSTARILCSFSSVQDGYQWYRLTHVAVTPKQAVTTGVPQLNSHRAPLYC
jgi:hypothetical protein